MPFPGAHASGASDMLRRLRAQRVGMINQEEQYVFAYTTILEEILKLAEDPGSSPPQSGRRPDWRWGYLCIVFARFGFT